MDTESQIRQLLWNRVPFAVWRMPSARDIQFLTGRLMVFEPSMDQQGFIFHPYNSADDPPIIVVRHGTEDSGGANFLPSPKGNRVFHSQDYQLYASQVNEAVSFIRKGLVQKLVLSRTIPASGLNAAEAAGAFLNLCDRYPAAFVYLFSGGEHMQWMGASPETLVKLDGRKGYTVSLAGTLPVGHTWDWTSKERIEQKIVTDFISEQLRAVGAEEIAVGEPFEALAGNLKHIKTEINFSLPDHVHPQSIVEALHPTPAVCGSPRAEAIQLIRAIEKHNRAYYTGFLGPWSINGTSHLFVNLRCMEFSEHQSTLFVGGGITGDSIAEREWAETGWKAETLSWLFNAK